MLRAPSDALGALSPSYVLFTLFHSVAAVVDPSSMEEAFLRVDAKSWAEVVPDGQDADDTPDPTHTFWPIRRVSHIAVRLEVTRITPAAPDALFFRFSTGTG